MIWDTTTLLLQFSIQDCSVGTHTNSIRKNWMDSSWNSPLECWAKINVHDSKRHSTRPASIWYVIRDNDAIVIEAKGKRMRLSHHNGWMFGRLWSNYNCDSGELHRIIIQSESQMIVNFTLQNMCLRILLI